MATRAKPSPAKPQATKPPKAKARTTPSRTADAAARLAALKPPITGTVAGAALTSPDKPLTPQQREFCRFRAEGENITTAMSRAGYSVKDVSYGTRMMAMPAIQKQIAIYQEEYRKAAELSKRDVMDMLKESYEMAKLMSEPATMVSAAREIGKMCGYYEPKKVQVDVSVNGSVKFEQLSDTELFAMIDKAAREAEMAEEEGQTPLVGGPQTA